MTAYTFSAEEMQELRLLNRLHPHPVIRHRALIMILKSQDMAHNKIAEVLAISKNTVTRYVKRYVEQGIEGLKKNKFL